MNANKLIEWYCNNSRNLPWRKNPEPYNIWISEIILQQTQMSRGVQYYLQFVNKYPDVFALSRADEQDVLSLWQGLGYYSRARNMHKTATEIVKKYHGQFPSDPVELKKLRGVGEYTAAAIASIAFNRKTVVVDGNVIRVISRLFRIDEPADPSVTLRKIKMYAFDLMGNHQPASFNQAIMELGALICKPRLPICIQCPLSNDCQAYQTNEQEKYPVKRKNVIRTARYFNYFHLKGPDGRFYIQQRKQNDIWKHLWEFPMIETQTALVMKKGDIEHFIHAADHSVVSVHVAGKRIHKLTHRDIHAVFYSVEMRESLQDKDGMLIIEPESFDNYPVHNLMAWGIKKILNL